MHKHKEQIAARDQFASRRPELFCFHPQTKHTFTLRDGSTAARAIWGSSGIASPTLNNILSSLLFLSRAQSPQSPEIHDLSFVRECPAAAGVVKHFASQCKCLKKDRLSRSARRRYSRAPTAASTTCASLGNESIEPARPTTSRAMGGEFRSSSPAAHLRFESFLSTSLAEHGIMPSCLTVSSTTC